MEDLLLILNLLDVNGCLEENIIQTFKARLVVKGFKENEKVDYFCSYCPDYLKKSFVWNKNNNNFSIIP